MQPSGNKFPLTTDIILTNPINDIRQLAFTFQFPVGGWKPIGAQPEDAGREAIETIFRFERENPGLEDVVIRVNRRADQGFTDSDMTNNDLKELLDNVSAMFAVEVSRQFSSGLYGRASNGDMVELAYAEIINQNKTGQQLKGAYAVRVTSSYSIALCYRDAIETWDTNVWNQLVGSLVMPGTFVPKAAVSSPVGIATAPISISQPVSAIPTPIAPQPLSAVAPRYTAPVVPTVPQLSNQPAFGAAIPPASPTSPINNKPKKSLLKKAAIFGAVVVLILVGIFVLRPSAFRSGLSDQEVANMADEQKKSIKSTQNVFAIGEEVRTGTYTFKVDRIIRNWQGESTKLYPGEITEFIHGYITLSNLTKDTVKYSAIDFTALADDEIMLLTYNPEPDDFGADFDISLKPNESVTKSFNIEVPAGTKSLKLSQSVLTKDAPIYVVNLF